MRNKTKLNWWNQLQVRIIVWTLIIMIAGILASNFIRKQHIIPLLEKESFIVTIEAGHKIVAEIAHQLEAAKSIAISMANLSGELSKDEKIHHRLIPALLKVKGLEYFIAGGGIWPEPYQFDPQVERHSFFWGRNEDNILEYYNDYNLASSQGYHHEEWYVPVKYLNNGIVYWSRSYADPYSEQPMVTVTAPIFKNDTFYGAATVDIKLDGIKKLVDKYTAQLGGYGFIVDRNGKFISFPDHDVGVNLHDEENYITLETLAKKNSLYTPFFDEFEKERLITIGKSTSSTIAQNIANASKQIDIAEAYLITTVFSVTPSYSDQTLTISYDVEDDAILKERAKVVMFNVAETDWHMVIVMPESLYLTAIARVADKIALFQIGIVTFIVLMIFIVIQRLVGRPLSNITRQLQYAVESKSTKNIKYEKEDELGVLASWFNQRTEQLRESEILLAQENERIKDKVKERTQELEENERKLARAVRIAEEEEQRLRIMINRAMDAVLQLSQEGEIEYWNKQAETIFGWTAEQAIGNLMHELIIPERDQLNYVIGYKRFLETGKSTLVNARNEVTVKTQAGIELQVEFAIAVSKHNDRNQYIMFVRDLTEQKKNEKLITQSRDEAQQANQAKSLFFATMSHELRTPMHGILSFSNFGLKKSETVSRDKLRDYFSNIHLSGQRLLNLLNDLLDIAKFESKKMELTLKSADLAEVFEQCCLEQEQRMIDLGLKINVDKPVHPMHGVFDSERILQLMLNLLSNAIKFSPEGETITVIMKVKDDKQLYFSIRDRGLGIPEEELDLVFDAFVQSSKTNTGAGGTGLGLAICKEIIGAHGGKIWAEQNPEGGAILTFILPESGKVIS